MWIFGYKFNSRKLYWHAHSFMKMLKNLKFLIAFLDSYSLSDVAAECSSQDIVRIDNTLKQILDKLNLLTNSNGYSPSSLLHSRACERPVTSGGSCLSVCLSASHRTTYPTLRSVDVSMVTRKAQLVWRE